MPSTRQLRPHAFNFSCCLRREETRAPACDVAKSIKNYSIINSPLCGKMRSRAQCDDATAQKLSHSCSYGAAVAALAGAAVSTRPLAVGAAALSVAAVSSTVFKFSSSSSISTLACIWQHSEGISRQPLGESWVTGRANMQAAPGSFDRSTYLDNLLICSVFGKLLSNLAQP